MNAHFDAWLGNLVIRDGGGRSTDVMLPSGVFFTSHNPHERAGVGTFHAQTHGRRCFENLLDMTATLSKICAQHARNEATLQQERAISAALDEIGACQRPCVRWMVRVCGDTECGAVCDVVPWQLLLCLVVAVFIAVG